MQALLSYDQSPPFAAPLRFFLSAPPFGMLSGGLLLWGGPDAFASRWTPEVLALTHLFAIGFMLQVMLGALLQILPVVAGANLKQPLRLAGIVHAALNVGTLLLAAAFLTYRPTLFVLASLALGAAGLVFVGSAARALFGVPSTSETISGIKLSLAALAVTLGLGLTLALTLAGWFETPLLQLADIHLGWGFLAWSTVLLAAVAYVVVPMFQLTPAYPARFVRGFAPGLLVAVALWSVGEGFAPVSAGVWLVAWPVAGAALFAAITLFVQGRSKRARFDATQRLWQLAMLCALAAAALRLLALVHGGIAEWPGWPLLCGALLLFGGFASVIVGMLYKIVPFLIWLHLQYQGGRRAPAPNMKKILDETAILRQSRLQALSALAVGAAAAWPDPLVYPAGVLLIAANGFLLRNLLAALAVYRAHQRKIAALAAA